MKQRKLLAFACAFFLMLVTALPFSVSAETVNESEAIVTSMGEPGGSVTATGLIILHSLSFSAGTAKVYITGKTIGSDIMAKIGFIDIEIQRSPNGYNGWTTVSTPSDLILQNAASYEINKYPISVTGGYYYRVHLTHYAKETGWFFPDSQSITVYSGAIWVPES